MISDARTLHLAGQAPPKLLQRGASQGIPNEWVDRDAKRRVCSPGCLTLVGSRVLDGDSAGRTEGMRGAKLVGIAVGLLLVAQLVPYGCTHHHPAVASEPSWNAPSTRDLFFRACRDCHSNETVWPWYSYIAPVSWLVASDVGEGREHFNVSDWDRPKQDGDKAAEMVREEDMPLWFYLPLHPEERLSAAERQQLIAGLAATFGSSDEASDSDH